LATESTSRGESVGGVDYPRYWDEFLSFFSSDEDCLAYLARLRGPAASDAAGAGTYWYRGDGRYLCCSCRRKTSVTAGTLFAGTRIGLRTWFAAAWYVVNQTSGVSALGLQRVLGFGAYETAWAWLHKLRRAMVPTSGKLTGNVEVDESYGGGVEAGASGRETLTESAIAIAVERRGPRGAAGRVRTRRIPNTGRDYLMNFIQDNVEPGATIITDGWPTYRNGRALGYEHDAHNVSKSGKQAHELLPACHRVSALLKRWLLGTHQGVGEARAARLLPRRVHFPLQPSLLQPPWTALLPAAGADRRHVATALYQPPERRRIEAAPPQGEDRTGAPGRGRRGRPQERVPSAFEAPRWRPNSS
jgi:hypothetical protein